MCHEWLVRVHWLSCPEFGLSHVLADRLDWAGKIKEACKSLNIDDTVKARRQVVLRTLKKKAMKTLAEQLK